MRARQDVPRVTLNIEYDGRTGADVGAARFPVVDAVSGGVRVVERERWESSFRSLDGPGAASEVQSP